MAKAKITTLARWLGPWAKAHHVPGNVQSEDLEVQGPPGRAPVRIRRWWRSDTGPTLVVMAHAKDGGIVIAHVGDSRAYRLRGQEFVQLTEDHSLVNHLMRFFHLTREQAMARAGSNVIVRAVGLEDDVDADLTVDQPQVGDIYLACSDGLNDMVDDWIIQQILLGNDDLQDAADALVRAANQAGGQDNITVVLLKAIPDG